MSEIRRYTPPETKVEAETEKLDKPKLNPETIRNIQMGPPEGENKPEATGEPIHWVAPDGNVITPEKEGHYRSRENLPEKEPGYGPKPSWSDDPGQITADDSTTNGLTDDDSSTDEQNNKQ